jgi:cytochrome b involved in lipid metabolism
MMRKLFIGSTAAFWTVVGGLWLAADSAAEYTDIQSPSPAKKSYSLQDVVSHNTTSDCWMAIHGQVYDVTTYLPDHPSRPEVIERWCGKEASEAYDTKTKGRPHSQEASRQLESYLIGRLTEAAQ